jgi:hypothetical protein
METTAVTVVIKDMLLIIVEQSKFKQVHLILTPVKMAANVITLLNREKCKSKAMPLLELLLINIKLLLPKDLLLCQSKQTKTDSCTMMEVSQLVQVVLVILVLIMQFWL